MTTTMQTLKEWKSKRVVYHAAECPENIAEFAPEIRESLPPKVTSVHVYPDDCVITEHEDGLYQLVLMNDVRRSPHRDVLERRLWAWGIREFGPTYKVDFL